MAGQGITQFIDLGAGLPTSPNTHVTAQEASPAATVAYVDNDPVVISHLTALLAHHSDRIAVISGDLRDRDVILGAPGLRAVIDLSKPVCVIMGMILHFETADAAAGLVKRYMSAVAPGSYLIATVASGKGARAEEFYQTYNASGFAAMYNHTSADFASFFGGLEIVPPDWATRGGSVPAGASSRRRPNDPTGSSRASPACNQPAGSSGPARRSARPAPPG